MAFNGSGAPLTNLNASNITSGTVPAARLGTGTPSTSNFLRGDGSWQDAAASALSASYALSAGASLVANRVAGLKSDGSVTNFVAPPAEGTKTTNFTGQSLGGVPATFPTRGIEQTNTGSNNFNTTLQGFYVTGTGRVNGSSINLGTLPGSFYYFGVDLFPDSQVEGVFYGSRGGYDNEFNINNYRFATIVVDSSGNISAGSYSTNYYSTLGLSGGQSTPITQVADNLFYASNGNQSFIVFPKTTGNPSLYSGKSADFNNLGSAGQTFFVNNNAQLLRLRANGTSTTCSWSGSSIGSPTNQSLISGASCVWTVNTARTRAFASYTDAEGNLKVSGFTINASTGALALVSTFIYQKVWSATPTKLTWVSDTYLVLTTNFQASTTGATDVHIAFQTDAGGNILNAGSRTTVIPSANYYGLAGNFIGQSSSSRVTWAPATTTGWVAPVIAGIAKATTSTSPASIVFNGVMSGFTGLVPGSKYYLADALDGTISTAIPTVTYPTELGTAISATDLNININSFNPNTLTQYTLPAANAVGAYYHLGVQSTESLPAGTWREMSSTNGGNGTVRLMLRIA